uniref:Arf-GAP with GTPase, ANK repeat and PH domain-containing protein 3 n=1 Tax=Schistosoma haematobium TaxID=6185 RepID=A0A095AJT9_SCHHA
MSSQSSLNDISNAIRQEIIRFESVHPNIYAIYDLIDAVEDKNLAESLRQLVVSIEGTVSFVNQTFCLLDAFVNSQEWTLSNGVPGIKLGLLGSVQSGKSALVHRYLTGAYVHDESPEGGRFKKELSLDNQSHLLLIRDEGGPPDLQFSQWVDGVIFVFSLENIESYQVVYDYYARLSTYRSIASLPIILVGTQDSNCEPYVRVIDDARARKLANDLKRCAYYETCAAYGLNVERVFQDACLKILQLRASGNSPVPRPITPQISSNSQQRACANSPVECVPIVGISQSQQSLFSNVVNAREGPLLMKNPGVNCNVTNSVTSGVDRKERPVFPNNPSNRRPDTHSNPGFELDFNEDSGLHQTLLHPTKPNLLSIAKHSFTLDFRPSERDNFFADVKPIRANTCTTDPAEDWATHPFLLDERHQHPLFRCPEYVPTEYSESIFQSPSPHVYSEYSGKIPYPPSTSDNGVSTPQPLSAPAASAIGYSPFIVSPNFPSGTLAAASSVSSIGLGVEAESKADNNESLTPSSTPTHSRKNRRKSNLFQKRNEDEREREKKLNGIGSGRAIPLKQGFLYKRTCKPLSKEWKTKKYVTLTDDARLTYHPSIHDYMDNSHGKEIDLSRTTVKIPGVAFRQVGSRITSNGLLRSQLNDGGTDRRSTGVDVKNPTENSAPINDNSASGGKDSSSVKKRHRRIKSNPKSNNADGSDSEGYEFQLISMDRQWHFEATGPDERDEWVMYIERAIMTRLQLNESSKRTRAIAATGCTTGGGGASGSNHLSNVSGLGSGSGRHGDSNSLNSSRCGAGDANELAVTEHLIQSIRSAAGNDFCADCGAPEPDWASLNLGAMVCISCSGIHRQLGTHISRIRSLHLDEWSTESVTVMSAIGNTLANSVWEAAAPVNAGNLRKPNPSSSREEKEIWIRAKYQHREFLPPLPYPDAPLQRQLIDAIARQDTRQVILCLALATPETVNAAYSLQDPRAAIHIAATLGNLVYLQLLLWYNGDPTVTDHEGRNAFYYAHCSKNYDCADFLLRNSCPKQLVPPIPPNNMPPTIRSSQNIMPQQIVQSHSIIHGPSTSTGLSSGVADINISNSINSGLVQPHHFSHLQQHQSSAAVVASEVGTHLSGQLPSYHPMTTGSVTANQQLSQGSNHPLVSASGNMYTGNVNQALGATLPRRRAPIGPFPPGAVPPTLQPFPRPNIQQQVSVSNTHRPTSSVIQSVTRSITPNAMLRTSLVSSSQPPHTRSASNTAATLSQPYVSTTQEVGL